MHIIENDLFRQLIEVEGTKNLFRISYMVFAVYIFEFIQNFSYLISYLTWFMVNFMIKKILYIFRWTLSHLVCQGATIKSCEWFDHRSYDIFLRNIANLLTNGCNSVTIKLEKFFLWKNSSLKFHLLLNSLLTCD